MSLLNPSIGPERVQVFPVPLGTVQIPGVATSVTAFLISTSKVGAPLQTPVAVTDFTTFVSTFGDFTNIANNAYYAVEAYFNNAGTGNTAIIVNVGSSPTTTDYIGNAGAGTGLRALDNQDILGLVEVPGLPLSLAYLVHPALIDYTKTVRAEFGATLSTSFSLLAIPKEIQLANTDALLLTLTVSGVVSNTVSFSGSPNLSSLTPGMIIKKAGSFVGTITAVDNVGKSVTLTSVGSITTADTVTANIPSAVTYKDMVVNDPSEAAAWYYNWTLMLDENPLDAPGSLVNVDPVGAVAGVIARIDANISIGGPSHAPAGIQYAGIAGIQGLMLQISERKDAEPLRLDFINRITSFPGAGNIIFGGYTAAGSLAVPDVQLVQVVRSIQYIKGSLERGLRGFLWENFSPDTQTQVSRAIQSFLRNNIHLFPAGLPEAQQFQVISVEPTQNDLDQGILRVRVQIKPNKAVRFIEIALEFPLPTS